MSPSAVPPSAVPPSAVPPLPLSDADVVTRLREAGCVFAEDEARLLSPRHARRPSWPPWSDRRAAGLPLEHVLGWAEFCGHRIRGGPRRVRAAPPHRVPDLAGGGPRPAAGRRGTARRPASGHSRPVLRFGRAGRGAGRGAGPGRAARRRHRPGRGAVRPPQRGRRRRPGLPGRPVPAAARGAARPGGHPAANVPYVPTGEIGLLPAEARLHEPRLALDGGADGLDLLRRVAAAAPRPGWRRAVTC